MKLVLTALALLTLAACNSGMTMNDSMAPDGASAETATLGNTVVN